MTLSQQWRVAPSRGACSRCAAEFPEEGVFFSALSESEEGLARRDYCRDCWQEADGDGHFCFWRTRRPPADEEPVLDTELMLDFFDRLRSADTEEKVAFRFVLALSLMRRRELKLQEVARGPEGEDLVLRKRRSGEQVKVHNPELDEEQIQAAAARLGQLFDARL